MKLTVHGTSHVTFYSMDVDVPADIVSKGEAAMVKWANDNIWTINGANVAHTETTTIQSVQSVTIER